MADVEAGVPAPFTDMRELSEDNGERSLLSYFGQQKERDETIGVTVAGGRCACEKCVSNVKPLYRMPWCCLRMMSPGMNRISLTRPERLMRPTTLK